MANFGRKRYSMEALGNYRVRIGGRFRPNGTSAIDATLSEGTAGWSVARSDVGLFLVTLEDVWPMAFDKTLSLELATAADLMLQWGDVDLDAKTLQIYSLAGATPTDIASDAGNWVNFGITVIHKTTDHRR